MEGIEAERDLEREAGSWFEQQQQRLAVLLATEVDGELSAEPVEGEGDCSGCEVRKGRGESAQEPRPRQFVVDPIEPPLEAASSESLGERYVRRQVAQLLVPPQSFRPLLGAVQLEARCEGGEIVH